MIGFRPPEMIPEKTATSANDPNAIQELIWRVKATWVRYDFFILCLIACFLLGAASVYFK